MKKYTVYGLTTMSIISITSITSIKYFVKNYGILYLTIFHSLSMFDQYIYLCIVCNNSSSLDWKSEGPKDEDNKQLLVNWINLSQISLYNSSYKQSNSTIPALLVCLLSFIKSGI